MKTPDGERIEVKAIRVTEGGNASRGLSPIRKPGSDAVVVVVFGEDFDVTEGLRIPRGVVEERFAVVSYRNAPSIRLTKALRSDPRVTTASPSSRSEEVSGRARSRVVSHSRTVSARKPARPIEALCGDAVG